MRLTKLELHGFKSFATKTVYVGKPGAMGGMVTDSASKPTSRRMWLWP